MIPIQLTIEGLYSYQERQTINFTELTAAGLFGIFGSVGSGKSSILEAISFVLYGETERLNSRDKRAYNMMNLKSDKSYIEFDFINYENKTYRVTRDFKRNSKKFEDVKPSSVVFYENIDEKWVPLEHSNAEQILGLSYANFKRTIIIPQGQFKEFLELGATERTNMMKEIFGLQRFDLQKNVSLLSSKNKSELDQLEGQLKGFEAVSEDFITAQNKVLEEKKKEYEGIAKNFKIVEEKYQNLKNLKQDFEVLNQKKEQFVIIKNQKKDIDELEIKTQTFDFVSRTFGPLLDHKNKLSKELLDQKKAQEKQAKICTETENEFTKIQKQLKEIQAQYDALEETKAKANDFALILQMLTYSEEIKTLKERSKKGLEKVNEVNAAKAILEKNTADINANIEKLKRQKIDNSLLHLVGNWFIENKNLIEKYDHLVNKTKDLEKEIQNCDFELQPFKINTETYKDDFKNTYDVLEQKQKSYVEKQNQLNVQQKLAAFANALHDGENCPLCGSLEHPHIVKFDDVNAEIQALEIQIVELKKEEEKLKNQFSEIDKIINKKIFIEEQLKREQEDLQKHRSTIKEHQKKFIWKEFSIDNEADFNAKKAQSFATEEEIEKLSQLLNLQQNTLQKERENLEKYQKALESFKLDEIKKEEQININKTNLKVLNWDDFVASDSADVEKQYHFWLEHNLNVEKKQQNLAQKEKEILPKLAEQKAHLSHFEKRIFELEQEHFDIEKNISEALLANKYNSLDDVLAIIAQNIDVLFSRDKIQNFRIEYQTLENSILQYEEKLKGLFLNENEFNNIENQFKTIEVELQNANNVIVKLEAEIDRLRKEFSKKEALLKDFNELSKRAENLKLMTNLFIGAGFVQYVSSIYLRQLCDHANIRFHRMTRNQLSLQLNDNNDFEIIDYLNEGKSRSVKTLSGGQSFQVSLSLALALAESVQANAKAEKNFFFIDEGFGTQDLESVNVVFETLMNLQKENRIVGIISHVEELKEKIPISLSITKDIERGSLIKIN